MISLDYAFRPLAMGFLPAALISVARLRCSSFVTTMLTLNFLLFTKVADRESI